MTKRSDPRTLELISPTDDRLNRPAEAVALEDVRSDFVQGTVDRMLEMAAGKGHSEQDTRQMVGLAAIQLGVRLRIVIIDVTADGSLKEQALRAFINPEITRRSDETVLGREGCWSCGNICGTVDRFSEVTFTALDRMGAPVELKLSDFIARITQHEVDHLDGIRFPDRIPEGDPSRLHWVEPNNFERYRQEWSHWQTLCPRERWDALKAGTQV